MPSSPRPRIEGYAIISHEGMIAEPDGAYPPLLKIEGDQRFFRAALDRAGAAINGAHSADRWPESAARPRIVLTRTIADLGRHPRNPHAILWNPAGVGFDAAWDFLGAPGAVAAVIGGTGVFDLFLAIGYDAFYLTRADVEVPLGRPVFTLRPGERPEDLLARANLAVVSETPLEQIPNTVVFHWERT